ncbi:hypothetical protein K6V98_07690 [Collinsella sp. AGMB00827]|uniref:LITAF domain-containing protein n=1 Tax=Collinsella ureilytica TaxID=2869515 RepID=A0ABS7MLI6_9ACTN|nr:hypothetical protein [Collinsella urealyticum]MBY4798226.1 hypothetical protein [Collinsella urealyticum]
MAKRLKCPTCGSLDISALGDSKRSVSAGKAIVGGLIVGPLGFVVGGLMGKKGKVTLYCHDCGTTWKKKL